MPRKASKPVRVLLTGFEPFGGSRVNPSQEVIRAIDFGDVPISGLEVRTRVLPVEAKRGPATLLRAVDAIKPDVVLCLGESGKTAGITLERVFINLADYRIADNAGVTLRERPIVRGGPAAHFSTLPLHTMRDAIAAKEVPVEFSLSAGAFLCNHVAYALLHHVRKRRMAAGFVHLPCLPAQRRGRKQRGKPSMKLETMLLATEAMLSVFAGAAAEPGRRWR